MNVVFCISGREAFPVRAIPYMAGTTVSADILVRGLLSVDPIHPLHGLSAYELLNYDVCRKVSPWEWSRFAIALRALTDRLHRQERDGELTTAECTAKWKQKSVKLLPTGVFLWKDEFQSEHIKSYRRLSSEELVKSSAEWIARMNELIASPDDSYSAELMAAQGAPENWREVLQEGIDEGAADRLFNPEQFYAYAPNWSAPKDTDTPADVTFTPMIDQDELAAVMEGFEEVIKSPPSSDSEHTPSGEGDGEIVQILSKWFDKPLADLPEKEQRIAKGYILTWSELSSAERRASAVEADHKRQTTRGLRFQQACREQEGLPSDRFAQRAMLDGFNNAGGGKTVGNHADARLENVDLSDAQCVELARKEALTIRDWRTLTGVGRGWAGAYLITSESVSFRKWTDQDMSGWPDEERDEMEDDNLTEPLLFPCTPARLLNFVDTVRHDLYGFDVPDAFRQAMNASAHVKRGAQSLGGNPAAMRGVTKQEILAVSWPLPPGARRMESILDERPKWVRDACIEVGRRGGGREGSHLWNPAILAICLATKTPHKPWVARTEALTRFIRTYFDDFFEQWEAAAAHL